VDVDLTLFPPEETSLPQHRRPRENPRRRKLAFKGSAEELKRLPAVNEENFLKQSIDRVTPQLYILIGNEYLKE